LNVHGVGFQDARAASLQASVAFSVDRSVAQDGAQG
jgi:hypothetical protein